MDDTTSKKPTGFGAPEHHRAANIFEIEATIKRYIVDLAKSKEQLKTQRDMYNDAFKNDAGYSESEQKVKEVARQKTVQKQKIVKVPSVMAVAEKMSEIKDEIKEMEDALSGYLQEYQKLSGMHQIIGDEGEVFEIVVKTKLVKKNTKHES